MRAAVLYGRGDLRVEEVPVPVPGPSDVLVRVHACGICASDVHYLEHGRIGRYVVDRPLILGHEVAGEIVAIGSEVVTRVIGQRVAIEPGVSCGRCDRCKAGRYNLCPDVRFFATPPIDGAMSEYAVIRADFAHPIADHVTYGAAAMCEPLSVAAHCAERTSLRPGDDVVVHGCGPIGLMAIVAARHRGARTVIATDVIERRLAVAASFGAIAEDVSAADLVAVVGSLTGGRGVDVIIDTSGVRSVIEAAPALAARGGSIAVVGLPADDRVTYRMLEVVDNELSIHGIFRYADTYRVAIGIVASGEPDVELAITHRFPLDDAVAAFDVARRDKANAIKVMIEV
jgi:L-iditol 2-dehydrogenase